MNLLKSGLISVIGFILVIGCGLGEVLDPNKFRSNSKQPIFGYYWEAYNGDKYGVKWSKNRDSIIMCEDALLESATREICSNNGYDYRVFQK